MAATESAVEYEYAVAHMEVGEVVETTRCPNRTAAFAQAAECTPDETGALCHVVRRPINTAWEAVE